MRLLRIELENLNSLYGKWTIDFERDFANAPIFLIHGKTGAGKSTLMDAVCLALFGQTPRLSEKRGEADFNAHHVMSRGTATASATLEFRKIEAGIEKRYRASWECRRANKRADKEPRPPVRKLERFDGKDWEVVVSSPQQKVFLPVFDEVLEGMTVADFKRTVLLAQGEFAAFLQVKDEERARILERLTSTEKYKLIGARAKERAKLARSACDEAKARLGGVSLLTDEQEQELAARLESAGAEERNLQAEGARTRARLEWCSKVAEARQQVEKGSQALQAARAELQARSADMDRLADHERCAGAGTILRSLTDRQAAIEAERSNLAVLETERASTNVEASAAKVALDEAIAQLVARSEAAKGKEPQLLEARRLRSELATARTELDKASKALQQARARRATSDKRLATSRAAELQAAQANAEAAGRAEQLKRFEPLVERIELLQSKHELVVAAEQQVMDLGGDIKSKERALERVVAKAAELESKAGGLRKLVADSKSRLEESSCALSDVLGTRADPAAMRKELNEQERATQKLQQALDEATRLLGEESSALEENTRLGASAALHQAECERLTASLAESEGKLAAESQSLETRRTDLEYLRWALRIAHERVMLKAGKACPLCGSEEHPAIADGRYAEEDRRIEERCKALEEESSAAQKQLKALEKTVDQLGKKRLKEEQEAGFDLTRRNECTARATSARRSIEALESASRTDFSAPDALPRVSQAIAASMQSIEHGRVRLEAAATQVASAQKALADAERKLAAAVEEAKDCGADHASITATIAGLRVRLQEASGSAERETQLLREAFASFGLRSDAADLGACLSEARSHAEAWKAADAEAKAAMERLTRARTQREKDEALLLESVEAENGACSGLQSREADAATLQERVRGVLGGEDPDQVQQTLQRAIDEATRQADACRKVHDGLERKLSGMDGRIESAKARVGEGALALETIRRQLDAALKELALSGDDDLRSRLLDEQQRDALTKLRGQLQQAVRDREYGSAELQKALERLLAARPEGADETTPLDVLREQSDAVQTAWQQALQCRIELEQKLAVQRRDRERAASLSEEFEKARADAEVWERLDSLIGTNEGGAFQLFAQTMNLQELVGRANDHLARLSNRYSLIPAPNRLAFMIRDEWQAGEERPLTTLSGGETFLVSLALALALADYRTVSMPIETLLLDEGFGTLDQDTLEAAMQALESLHAGGMQVGVISHVDALKEKIPARIHVQKLGNGRSRVSVETS